MNELPFRQLELKYVYFIHSNRKIKISTTVYVKGGAFYINMKSNNTT